MKIGLAAVLKIIIGLVYLLLAYFCFYTTYFLPSLSSISIIDHVVVGVVLVSALLYTFSALTTKIQGSDFVKIDFKSLLLFVVTLSSLSLLKADMSDQVPIWRDEQSEYDLTRQHRPFLACSKQSQPPLECSLTRWTQYVNGTDHSSLRRPSLVVSITLIGVLLALLFHFSGSIFFSALLTSLIVLQNDFRQVLIEIRPYSLGLLLNLFFVFEIFLLTSQKPDPTDGLKKYFGLVFSGLFLVLTIGFQGPLMLLAVLAAALFFKSNSTISFDRHLLAKGLLATIVLFLPLQYLIFSLSFVARSGINSFDLIKKSLQSGFLTLNFNMEILGIWLSLLLLTVFVLFRVLKKKSSSSDQEKNQVILFLLASAFFLVGSVFLFKFLIRAELFPRYLVLMVGLFLVPLSVFYKNLNSALHKSAFGLILIIIFTFQNFNSFQLGRPHFRKVARIVDYDRSQNRQIRVASFCIEKISYLCFSQNERNFYLDIYFSSSLKNRNQGQDIGSLELYKILTDSEQIDDLYMIFERNTFPDIDVTNALTQLKDEFDIVDLDSATSFVHFKSKDMALKQQYANFVVKLNALLGPSFNSMYEYLYQAALINRDIDQLPGAFEKLLQYNYTNGSKKAFYSNELERVAGSKL